MAIQREVYEFLNIKLKKLPDGGYVEGGNRLMLVLIYLIKCDIIINYR